jgi:hypothetical protein
LLGGRSQLELQGQATTLRTIELALQVAFASA